MYRPRGKIVIGGKLWPKSVFLSRFKLTISKDDLIQSHYKYLETFSKLVPHAWIAIIGVKDLTYAVSKCTCSNI